MDFYNDVTMLNWEVKRRIADLTRDTSVPPPPEFGFSARVAEALGRTFSGLGETLAALHRPARTHTA
jgi:hypothetical protein